MIQKDLLAKLLATEDLTVLHKNAQTASFDTQNRILTLPIWKEMTSETYDHLTGHEVGHALYTPNDDWSSAVTEKTKAFKSFLNVVEDARIEKLIQRRYPGLRRSFVVSYKKMLSDGMFGAGIDEINNMKLIDRLNVFFKCGATVGIDFGENEVEWVKKIENIETFEEALTVAEELYALAKSEKEEEEAAFQNEIEYSEGDEDEQDGEEFDSEDFEIDDESDDEEEETPATSVDSESDEDLISETDQELSKNIDQKFNEDSTTDIYNVLLNTADTSSLIVPFDKVIKDFEDHFAYKIDYLRTSYGNDSYYTRMYNIDGLYKKFINDNRKSINYLVKEFEMKKSAAEYYRGSTAKTGVIDAVKLHSYKFNDDIFKKVSVVPEGKNHGMIMYIDWSGSMWQDMKATIEQLLNLVHFCRQVNIPFRVYAFTDGYCVESESIKGKGLLRDDVANATTFFDESFRYIELFSNKMKKKDLIKMAEFLLKFGDNTDTAPNQYRLHATPLDAAIIGASSIYNKFLSENGVDIINTIILTDGESHSAKYKDEDKHYYSRDLHDLSSPYYMRDQIARVIDPITKKTHNIRNYMNNGQWTDLLLKIYRERTGSNVIGFRILPTSLSGIRSELRYANLNDYQLRELGKQIRKENYVNIPTAGYTKYFALAGGENLRTSNGSFEVAENASTSQLRNAFKKASKNRVGSRALLNEFVKEVA